MGNRSLLQGIFPTQGSNPCLPHCRQILHQLSQKESPRILRWVVYPFSRGSSWPRNWTRVSCIVGGFFSNLAIREALIMDETRAYYTEWSKSEREKQISYINVCIWNLERWYWWTYSQSSNGDIRHGEQTCQHSRRRTGWDEWREQRGNIYTTICKTDSQEFAIWLRGLWQPRRVRWEMGRRLKREGTYVYLWLIHVDVWQKPTQYCKAIILQLKIN